MLKRSVKISAASYTNIHSLASKPWGVCIYFVACMGIKCQLRKLSLRSLFFPFKWELILALYNTILCFCTSMRFGGRWTVKTQSKIWLSNQTCKWALISTQICFSEKMFWNHRQLRIDRLLIGMAYLPCFGWGIMYLATA